MSLVPALIMAAVVGVPFLLLIRELVFPSERVQVKQAERRWRAHNREYKTRGCPCGRPGTIPRDAGPVTGSVRPIFWYCDLHADVSLERAWRTYPDGHGELAASETRNMRTGERRVYHAPWCLVKHDGIDCERLRSTA